MDNGILAWRRVLVAVVVVLAACGGGGGTAPWSDTGGSDGDGGTGPVVTAPAIQVPPQDLSVNVGDAVQFSVSASGTAPLTYQWLRDGVEIAGATAAQLDLTAAQADDAARFSVRVGNVAGTVTSAQAVLHLLALPAAAAAPDLRVSAGAGYALALRSDGAVLAWGSNILVPLTAGMPQAGSAATRLPLAAAADVSAGPEHALVLGRDGHVWGWGAAGAGRLGSHINILLSTPVELPGVSDATQVLALQSQSLALRADGSVAHWPGTASFSGSSFTVAPGQVAGLGDVVRLVPGGGATVVSADALALRADGSVWALTANQTTVGLNTTVRFSASAMAGLGSVADIHCGTWHCLVLRTDGSVIGWGDNANGQLGLAGGLARVPAASPVAVPVPAGVQRVLAVGTASLLRAADGRVWTWGGSPNGQRSAGDLARPTPLALTVAAAALSAPTTGSPYVLVAGEDGSVHGWGSNSGQLADGSTLDRDRPVRAVGINLAPDLPSITAWPVATSVAVGEQAGFTVSTTGTGTLRYDWLRDGVLLAGATTPALVTPTVTAVDDGALYSVRVGDGQGSLRSAPVALNVTPVPLLAGRPVRAVADTLYAYEGTAAGAWQWGDGSADADGAQVSKAWRLPGRHAVSGPGGAFQVTAIGRPVALGLSHSCAIDGAGTPQCWGRNQYGQLGDGSTVDRLQPVAVSGLGAVVSVVSGQDFSCALQADGAVACWGRNASGQLGDGTQLDRSTPQAVAGLADVVAIAAGDFHACALLRSGAVQCWGSNFFGAVGDGSSANNRLRPVAVGNLVDAVSIAAGSAASCAVRRDATLVCWGALSVAGGDGFGAATPTVVPGLAQVVAVSIGASHACALRADRRVLCWGGNAAGQLGDSSTTARGQPTLVAGLADASSISAGSAHTCASRVSLGPVCWGSTLDAAVGDGDADSLFTTQGPMVLAPRPLFGLELSTAVQAGSRRSCALAPNGVLRCWGSGGYGEMGTGSAGAQHFTPVVVDDGRRFWK